MEKLCAAIGFTKEMIESLLTKKEAIRCNGRIYSEEHRRKFDIKNDVFKVERNPTDNNKLVLTITGNRLVNGLRNSLASWDMASGKHLMNREKEEGLNYKIAHR